jgi:replicative DNA helicase
MKHILKLANIGRTPDHITVADSMDETGELDAAGGIAYLVELSQNVPGTANIKSYAQIVCDRAMERRITAYGARIAELGCEEGVDVDSKLETLHSEVGSLERKGLDDDYEDFNQILKRRVTALDEKFSGTAKRGIEIGFADLDTRFQGITETDLWVLAARPSMGKSALAFNIALNIARSGKEVLIFSMEMSQDQVVDRMISSLSGIDSKLIRSGQLAEGHWPMLSSAIQRLKDLKIHIWN